ncbi:uncharacterized protein LOC122391939 isoform X2 [Amphibalanus amphitrite]|uniref:uncharacterized protein LOC122364855 n=2 Tax=Amphibalanus amphitrite TaxID=1232801 RepID=UPI001C924518|nr:uncharacterized protein LOC122364855 [Amphibalanus amphitrite]XP_043202079.1 uncharacterized protein LOC122370490 [Amphibalanus amphitrite]XP_043209380.1 uncharacterized protein LOC122374609 [Amphibalanus amphitrite]XP_043209720.1 uncharacterized protein LOC122374802 [Amphibalanus amphitrite]XP_043242238.1 uncharacterized protein LOC122391939 isoform X2 [Amphibalanus amphitrite]
MLSKLRQGKPIGAQARQVVYNVYQYFIRKKDEYLKQGDESAAASINVAKETSSATGVSIASVNAFKSGIETHGCQSPARQRPNRGPREYFDEFDQCAFRRMVHAMYLEGKKVTLDTIRAAVQDKFEQTISRSTIRKQLFQIGFKFRQVNNRKLLVEKPQVVAARNAFLRRIRKIRSSDPERTIVYLDETWYNQFDMRTVAWLDSDDVAGHKPVTGKGKRLIIVDAGSDSGFTPGAFMCMRTDGKSADYHTSMNASCFEDWFRLQLLPNLPANSVIIMDNASYHSRCANKAPTASWRKEAIQEWLRVHDVNPDPDLRKVELLELVRPLKQTREYVLDKVAQEAGHEVLRLPPYHCDLNPIEMVWANMKTHVRQFNNTGHLNDVERLLLDSRDAAPPDLWRNCCRHVRELEEVYWRADGMMEDIEPVIVSLQDSSSDDSDSESD